MDINNLILDYPANYQPRTNRTGSVRITCPADTVLTIQRTVSNSSPKTIKQAEYTSAQNNLLVEFNDSENLPNYTQEEYLVRMHPIDGGVGQSSRIWFRVCNVAPEFLDIDTDRLDAKVKMKVKVSDNNGDPMIVKFYNANTHQQIGSNQAAENGDWKSQITDEIPQGTNFQWYATVQDNHNSITMTPTQNVFVV